MRSKRSVLAIASSSLDFVDILRARALPGKLRAKRRRKGAWQRECDMRLFQNRWWIPVAACIGIMVGLPSVLVLSFAVFLKPVTAALGWTRGEMSSAPLVTIFFTLLAQPLLGRLVDRFGFRRIMLPAFVLFSLAMASLSLIGPQIWIFVAIYGTAQFFGASSGPLAYSKCVAMWFDKNRGLALGVATAGAGFGTVVMPLLAEYLITHQGWRFAYFALAMISGVVGCIVVALFIREPPNYRSAGPRSAPAVPGLTAGEAARKSWRFWTLGAIFLLGGITINGTLAHSVALLTDRGWTPLLAASAYSASGAAAVLARFVGGWCLDRLFGPYVAAFCMLLAAVGMALLWSHAAGAAPVLGLLCLGVGLGLEIDAMGFLISRYFGLKSFGAIYGVLFPAFTVGVALGPAAMGITFDRVHSYDPALAVFFFLLLVTASLLSILGPYTYAAEKQTTRVVVEPMQA
jgi:MFS family permease